jgi:SAM-dependent methyltransferase
VTEQLPGASAADLYEDSGEFLDVLLGPLWAALADPVAAALDGADPAAGPLVDLGAGTGRGLTLLAAQGPDAEVLAVEPSPVLRAVLLARVAADPELRRGVTVVASTAQDVLLPDRVGAVLAMNMIGHLSAGERRALWTSLASRLAPGAPLVVNVQAPFTPEPVPPSDFPAVQVGRLTYVGRGHADVTGPQEVTWHLQYRVLDASGATVRSLDVAYPWVVMSPSTLVAELTEAGLEAMELDGAIVRAVGPRGSRPD